MTTYQFHERKLFPDVPDETWASIAAASEAVSLKVDTLVAPMINMMPAGNVDIQTRRLETAVDLSKVADEQYQDTLAAAFASELISVVASQPGARIAFHRTVVLPAEQGASAISQYALV